MILVGFKLLSICDHKIDHKCLCVYNCDDKKSIYIEHKQFVEKKK